VKYGSSCSHREGHCPKFLLRTPLYGCAIGTEGVESTLYVFLHIGGLAVEMVESGVVHVDVGIAISNRVGRLFQVSDESQAKPRS
jgi:hypothetical protein